MSKIRIKNFGPIKEGYLENDGWLDVKKVTVFIGNQGSGKSTVAKAISTMTWIEKALVRGDFEMPQSRAGISTFFDYQNLKNYFRKDTQIEYEGDAYSINYRDNSDGRYLTIKNAQQSNYLLPKIMYVPAERNFLSVIVNAFGVKGLPDTLFTFGEEFKRAQRELNEQQISLPINNYRYVYDKQNDTSFIIGDNYKLNLIEASSGLHSFVPLYLVSKNLAELLNKFDGFSSQNMNVTQSLRMSEEISKIMTNKKLSDNEKLDKVFQVTSKFENRCFINIVEEPEQNLFPSSQQKMLNSLLEFNNKNKGNKLIMTTHSPYLINYLTLCVKANEVYSMLVKKKHRLSDPEYGYVNEIVPMSSTVDANDLVIYELDEHDGTIKKLGNFEGIPSDKNFLNKSLRESNELFDSLLEIEEEL